MFSRLEDYTWHVFGHVFQSAKLILKTFPVQRFVNDLGDEASVEKGTAQQGNQMTMILQPNRK